MVDDGALMFEVTGASSRSAAIDAQSIDRANARVQTGPHGHRDLEVLYFRSGSGTQLLMGREWPVNSGDVVLIPPRAIHDVSTVVDASGWAVEFRATALEGVTGVGQSLQLWRSNPLLSAFLAAEAQVEAGLFRVDEADRPRWENLLEGRSESIADAGAEQDQAVRAYLLLLLIEVARVAGNVENELRYRHEPILADTFGVIEAHFAEDLSTRDVAESVGMSPGHLTTLGHASARERRWATGSPNAG